MSRLITACVATLLVLGCISRAENPKAAAPATTIPLAGVEGRIDHMAVDDKGARLFLAALGNDTLEVIDLKAGKVTDRISGLRAPQGVAFAPDLNRLAVANDKDGSCRIYDGSSLKQVGLVDLKDDADNVRYDAGARCFYVGYGDGALAAIDPAKAQKIADIKL